MTTSQIANALSEHRVSADSWGWRCSCGVSEQLSDLPLEVGVNPGEWRQADARARTHVAEQIAA